MRQKTTKAITIGLSILMLLTNSPFVYAQETVVSPPPSAFESANKESNLSTGTVLDIPEKEATVVDSSAQVRLPVKVHTLRKNNFRANEKVSVIIENANWDQIKVKVFLVDGTEVPVAFDVVSKDDPVVLKLSPKMGYRPGRYRLKVTDSRGEVSTQDFTWGVLAINTDKSIYKPNETAKIAIAVLDETGMMVCDAKVNLEIKNPKGEIQNLSTEDGGIKVNEECSLKDYTERPDYETEYQIGEAGVYAMTLLARTENGEYTVTDNFEVRDEASFDVARFGPTRIYPPSKYPVRLEFTALKNFEGTVTEYVPSDFEIEQLDGVKAYDGISEVKSAQVAEGTLDAPIFDLGVPFKGNYPVTLGFGGQHKDPLVSKKYTDFGVVGHDGVDFGLPEGTEVVAVDKGKVARARENYDYGSTIVIEHNWGKSYYGHLSKFKVKEGDEVKKGDVIALSGMTGLASGPHLHFGIKPNSNDPDNGYYGKVDPKNYLVGKDDVAKVLAATSEINPSVKLITWKVSARAGEKVNIGYKFKAPNFSPYLYLLGPAEFKKNGEKLLFQEARQWQIAADAITGTYTTFYGTTGAAGTTLWATLNGETEGAEVAGDATSASPIDFIKSVHAPTRDEEMVGHIKEDGRLDILTCTGSCDAATDDTLQFNKAIDAAQACDVTFGSCWRQFDIAYEQLSGDAMVAFINTASDGVIQYCTYNGSSWTPSSCTTPNTFTYQATGPVDGKWVRLIARGEGLKTTRTDEILLVVGDANSDIFAARWDGSTWGNLTTITSSASTFEIQNFDGAWEETTGNALVVWAEGTTATTTPFQYKKWTRSSTTWDSTGTNMTITGTHIGHWVTMKGAPIAGKDHIAIITQSATTMGNNCVTGSNCAAQPWIWTGGASPTMTKGNECASTEPTHQRITDVAVESVNAGSVQAFYVCGLQTSVSPFGDRYETWVEGTGFSAVTDFGGTADPGDDPEGFQITGHPNSNEVQVTLEDVDADCNHNNWSGSATLAAGWDIAACSSGGVTTLAPTTHTAEPNEGTAFWVSATPYSNWSRNWRWWDAASDANTTPSTSTALAAENTAPIVGDTTGQDFRLRINYAELTAGPNETDSRKKLQFVSSATCSDPNSCANSNWTDVDDIAGAAAWRYSADADVTCTPTDCDDDVLLAGTVLTGTNGTCSAGNGCGTFVADKDAAGGVNMDHNSTIVQESEYIIENNSASAGVIYYFRLFDVGDDTSIFRQQDLTTVCAGSSACTYPSLNTSVVDQFAYRWRSDDGNETTGTNLVNENTAYTSLDRNTNIRLRFTMNSTAGTTSLNYRLEWAARVGASCDTDEVYAAVPDTATTEAFDMTTTANYTDQAASTNVTTGPGVMTDPGVSTFTAGKLVESTSNSATSITLAASRFTEHEYSFQANNNATQGGNYCLRLTHDGSPFTSYTNYAAVTITAPAGPTMDQVMRHGKWFNASGVEQPFTF